MPTTCSLNTLLAACLAFPLLAQGLSLEDKVSQARKTQAESAMGIDAATADSLIAERRNNAKGTPGKTLVRANRENAALDSMLTGPTPLDTGKSFGDSTWVDSNGVTHQSSVPIRSLPKRYEQRIFQNVDQSAFSSPSGAAGRDYVLGPGDEITVAIWGDKEKEYELALNREGKIFLEGIGQVVLGGMSIDAAQQVLKQRLAKVYSGISRGSTSLGLTLSKSGPVRVFVLGEVKVPGGFAFTGNSSVLTAMYFAKGPTDIGTVRDLQLSRSGTKYPMDLYKYLLRGEGMSPRSLQDGDIIFAGRAEALVEIVGDVGRPATYEMKKGEGVKELLEFAGGVNPTVAAQAMTLRRIFPDGKPGYLDLAAPRDYLSGKTRMELQDGDKVTVYKSTELAKNFLTVTGPVKYPGTYEAAGVTTVQQLIEKAGGLREDAFLGRVHVVRFQPDGSSRLIAYSLDSTVVQSIPLEPRDNVLLYSIKDMYTPDSVEIRGAVFNPGKYEFRAGMSAQDLVMQAGGLLPHHETGRGLVFRGSVREHNVEQIPISISANKGGGDPAFALNANDFLHIPVDPKWYKKEIVSLEGLFVHPGSYALLYPGEKLASVIDRAGGFKASAYIEGGRFFRSKDSVGRVGVNIQKGFTSRNSKANIPMVGGDSIYIPDRLNTVKVIGEVGFETSVLYKDGAGVQYYIESAGGFTRRSEKNRIVVQYANGETSRDGYFNRKPDAGSIIYIPQGPEPKQIDWIGGINVLLGTIGLAVALILSIQAISKS